MFKLKCELFEYSNEAIDTGVDAIDAIETTFGSRTTITLGAGTGTFEITEEVTQDVNGIIVTGEIAEIRDGEIDLVGITASDSSNTSFDVTSGSIGNIIGETSSASFGIISKDALGSMDSSDTFADNEEFEITGNNFIDFGEINPFGIPDTL